MSSDELSETWSSHQTHRVGSSEEASEAIIHGSRSASPDEPSESGSITNSESSEEFDPVLDNWRREMRRDLRGSQFECETLLDQFCPAESQIVDGVLSALKNRHSVSHENLRYRESGSANSEIKPWPDPLRRRRHHYGPFAWLLNEILTISNELLPPNNIHRDLRFLLYKAENTPEDDSQGLIVKPELLGYHHPEVDENTRLSWKDALICVEVNDCWPDCVVQASMYAYCCYATQPTRIRIPAIHFKHSTMDVRIGFYTRNGLYVTEDLGLTKEDGFRKFVCGIVGFNSWTDPSKAGFDITRTDKEMMIPGQGVYTIVHTYTEMPGITGRATRVYKLVKKETGERGFTVIEGCQAEHADLPDEHVGMAEPSDFEQGSSNQVIRA